MRIGRFQVALVLTISAAIPASAQSSYDDRKPTRDEIAKAQVDLFLRLQARLKPLLARYALDEAWLVYCRQETDRKMSMVPEGMPPFRANYHALPTVSSLQTIIQSREAYEYQDAVLCLANVRNILSPLAK